MPKFLEQVERHLPGIRPHSADGYIALGLICVLATALAIILASRQHRRIAAWTGTIGHGLCILVPVLDGFYSVSFTAGGRMDRMHARIVYGAAPVYFILGCAVIWGTLLVLSRIEKGRR